MRRLVLVSLILFAFPLFAYQPHPTSPYTFSGTGFCSDCETVSQDRVDDGNFHDPGCEQSGSPLYFCTCSIGYNASEMLKAPVLSINGDGNVEIEYWAKNIYCNPPADGGTIYEPNAISYKLIVQRIDPVTLVINPTPVHVFGPYWEHGKIVMTDLNPSCNLYRVLYFVQASLSVSYAVSSDVIGATGASGGKSCLADLNSCAVPGGAVSPSVGKPINVGSGNMQYAETLFNVSGPGGAGFGFSLTYNSRDSVNGPLGPGFTHNFAQTLAPPTSGSSARVLRGAAGQRVLSVLETHPPVGNIRRVIYPGDVEATTTVAGSLFRMTDLAGRVSEFDDSAGGRWTKFTDRWSNNISGTYTSGALTKITDALGREWTLAYSSGKLASITDGSSNQWRFEYDGSGRLEKIFDPLHTSTTPWRQFSWTTIGGSPYLVLVTDDSGAILEGHQYDANGRAISSWSGDTVAGSPPSPGTNARDHVQLSYDSPTQTTVTTAVESGVTQTSVYTLAVGSGRFLATSITGGCGSCGTTEEAATFTFDRANHVLSKTVGLDLTGSGGVDERVMTTYTYDANGNLLTETEADGEPEEHTITRAYGMSTWPEFVTSISEESVAKPASSKTTTFSWSGGETVLTTTVSGYLAPTDVSPTTITTTETFDARHRLIQADGPRANQSTTWSYYSDSDVDLNRRGRLSGVTKATTTLTSLSTTFDDYDVYGKARKTFDPNGVETRLVLDARGRATESRSVKPASDSNEPADYVETITYDGRDRHVSTTTPRGLVTKFVYESGTNRLLQTIRVDGSNHERERLLFTLGGLGQKIGTDAQDCTTPATTCSTWVTRHSETYEHDTAVRLVKTIRADSSEVDYAWDSRGNRKSVKDERHAQPNTLYAFDVLDRLTEVRQKRTIVSGSDVVTEFGYDAHGNRTTLTDPNGNVTTWAFDDFGRMKQEVSPVTGTTTFSHDASHNLASTTDANGATTAYTYDLLDRVLTATSTRSLRPTEVVSWSYDSATAGNYGKGRIDSMSDPVAVTSYAYERRGLLRYEERDLEVVPAELYFYVATYGYDANGNRTSILYPSGQTVDTAYDFADRPVSASTGITPIVTSSTFYPFGPRRQIVFPNGTTQTFAFDTRYRVTSNQLTTGLGTLASYAYGSDAAANLTSMDDLVNANSDRAFGYDDLNRLITANSGSALWGAGSYTYDAMGNPLTISLANGNSSTFSYSSTTPKLTSVVDDNGTTSVTYDSAGNETQTGLTYKISSRNLISEGSVKLEQHLWGYDGRRLRVTEITRLGLIPMPVETIMFQHYGPEKQLLSHVDCIDSGFFTCSFGYDLVWFGDRPVAQLDFNLGTLYTFADHLGTPLMQTDGSAAVRRLMR